MKREKKREREKKKWAGLVEKTSRRGPANLLSCCIQLNERTHERPGERATQRFECNTDDKWSNFDKKSRSYLNNRFFSSTAAAVAAAAGCCAPPMLYYNTHTRLSVYTDPERDREEKHTGRWFGMHLSPSKKEENDVWE